jgi:hypothetical protein
MTTEYDRLTLRSIDAWRELELAEQEYQRAAGGAKPQARHQRDVALRRYLAIEAERKRADPPPAPGPDSTDSPG